MASRWKGKGRSSSLQHRVEELECLLASRDETIAELEKKLSDQLESVKKLRRERDELRSKNASLVVKVAEVSRKHSIANNTPPLPR